MLEVYIIGLIMINLISLVMMAMDKQKAKKRTRRISEFSFLVLSLLGGFVGVFVGIFLFRHKTIKRSFQLKILFGAATHLLILYLFNKYLFPL